MSCISWRSIADQRANIISAALAAVCLAPAGLILLAMAPNPAATYRPSWEVAELRAIEQEATADPASPPPPEPRPVLEPQFVAESVAEEPTEPEQRWPWATATPGWNEAQAHPEAYAQWLSQMNGGQRVEARWAEVTAYTPGEESCGVFADGRTATGARTDLQPYGLAVTWRWIHSGRQIHVPGYMPVSYPARLWRPDDVGGDMRRAEQQGRLHIDVRYRNPSWCRNHWERRSGWVFVTR